MVSGMNVSDSTVVFGTQVGYLPYVLVTLTGLVLSLLLRRRIGRVSAVFAIAGFALLLVLEIADVAWIRYLPRLLNHTDGVGQFNAILLATNVGTALLASLGLSLVIVALFTRRAATPAD
jgi:hypothetical protein